MSSPLRLMRELRSVGGTLRLDGDRLLVSAPTGLISSALRAQLIRYKAQVIAVLRETEPSDKDLLLPVIELLAVAWRRHERIPQVSNRPGRRDGVGVALCSQQSVHGGGQEMSSPL